VGKLDVAAEARPQAYIELRACGNFRLLEGSLAGARDQPEGKISRSRLPA